jgi:hypothetical protein
LKKDHRIGGLYLLDDPTVAKPICRYEEKGETSMVKTLVTLLVVLSSLSALAQTKPQKTGSVPIYRIIVVARTTQAINYRHRSGATRINFKGTTLLPEARGNAEVASK